MENLIALAINKAGLTQAGISRKLGVSKTQVSKWNAGERIPYDREDQLLSIIGMSREEVTWMPFVKDSKEIADWVRYFTELQSEEFMYLELMDLVENEQVSHIMECLQQFSVKIPSTPPMEDLEDGELCDFSQLIYEALDRAGRLVFWVKKNINYHEHDEADICCNLEFCCLELALTHLNTEMYGNLIESESRFREKRYEAQNEARGYLTSYCELLKEKGMPIGVDYFEILSDPPERIVDEDDVYEMPFSNIADYYSHPEREILKGQRYLRDVLYELHRKIDCLLTDDMKTALDSGISITKPFFPYPPENKPS